MFKVVNFQLISYVFQLCHIKFNYFWQLQLKCNKNYHARHDQWQINPLAKKHTLKERFSFPLPLRQNIIVLILNIVQQSPTNSNNFFKQECIVTILLFKKHQYKDATNNSTCVKNKCVIQLSFKSLLTFQTECSTS